MAVRVIFSIPAVAAAVFTTAIEIGAVKWALAASDCIEEPNREAPPGGHWFYRTDTVNNRKCWHVEPPSSPQTEAPKAEPPSSMSQVQAAKAEVPEPSTRGMLEEEPRPHAKFLRPFNQSEFEPIEE
jgi:hypothetical protein